MRILGVDPGMKATGYGVIEILGAEFSSLRLLEAGTIEPRTKDPLPHRIDKVYQCLSEIIRQFSPDILVLEKLYSHHRHPTTACLLGHVRGVILLVSAHHHLEVVEHSVKRIRKSVCGDGNASKEQVRDIVKKTLKIQADTFALDASDALALALGFARMQDVMRY